MNRAKFFNVAGLLAPGLLAPGLLAPGLLGLLGLLGCGQTGPERASVAGQITFAGAPVERGSLALIPTAGSPGPAAGAEILNGQYQIDADNGPAPGAYRVEIKATRETGRQFRDEFQPPPNNLKNEVEQYLPAKYNVNSELTIQVAPGANEAMNFELQP